MPEPGSSGGFNRYRYTRNNPLRYTDPSGHCVLCIIGTLAVVALVVTSDQAQPDPNIRLGAISREAVRLAEQAKNGDITDLEAMAQITEYGAPLYDQSSISEVNAFAHDMAEIFVGFNGPLAPLYAADERITRDLPGGPYKLDPSSEFTIYGREGVERLQDSGFAQRFQDGSSQPRHFWFAVEVEMMYPSGVNSWQARAHEDPNHWLGAGDGSEEDTNLSTLGGELGRGLDDGRIKPSEVGDWIRLNLGD